MDSLTTITAVVETTYFNTFTILGPYLHHHPYHYPVVSITNAPVPSSSSSSHCFTITIATIITTCTVITIYSYTSVTITLSLSYPRLPPKLHRHYHTFASITILVLPSLQGIHHHHVAVITTVLITTAASPSHFRIHYRHARSVNTEVL